MLTTSCSSLSWSNHRGIEHRPSSRGGIRIGKAEHE
jgi:hypothetical protein